MCAWHRQTGRGNGMDRKGRNGSTFGTNWLSFLEEIDTDKLEAHSSKQDAKDRTL